jgi:hypothetical protein
MILGVAIFTFIAFPLAIVVLFSLVGIFSISDGSDN